MGSTSPAIEPIARDLPTAAWTKVFTATDPAEGGCPDVTRELRTAV
jgi:hypothetical protein